MWIVGSVLFVIAVAVISYSEIKKQFDAVANSNKIDVSEPFVADWVYKRFYSDTPREQFDKQIASTKRIADPKVIEQLKAIVSELPTADAGTLSQWTDDELTAFVAMPQNITTAANPWKTLGMWVSIAVGIPLAVLIIGASLVWAFSGFAAKRP